MTIDKPEEYLQEDGRWYHMRRMAAIRRQKRQQRDREELEHSFYDILKGKIERKDRYDA